MSEPRTCDLSRGIVTDDASGTITFHLVAPDPEFLYKLTLPFAYPVPPSAPDEQQVEAGVPGTGPYMLEAPMTDEGLALVRNPHFHVWSPAAQPDGYVDRIEWTFGVEPEAQVDAVAAGDADLAFDAYLPRTGSKSSSYGSRRRSIPLRAPRRTSSCSTPRRLPSMTSRCDGR